MLTQKANWLAFIFFLLSFSTSPPLAAEALSDAEIRSQIVEESIVSYEGSCPCPYSLARDRSICGDRSAYSRPGGETPKCYASDVSDEEVQQYRTVLGKGSPEEEMTDTGSVQENGTGLTDLESRVQQLEGRVDQLESSIGQEQGAETSTPQTSDLGGWRTLEKGMTKQQVRELLGEPLKIEGNTIFGDRWWYSDNRFSASGYVRFDTQERLEAWSEP